MQQVAVSVADPGQTPSEHDLDFVYVRATRTIKSLFPYTYGVQVMVLETWMLTFIFAGGIGIPTGLWGPIEPQEKLRKIGKTYENIKKK